MRLRAHCGLCLGLIAGVLVLGSCALAPPGGAIVIADRTFTIGLGQVGRLVLTGSTEPVLNAGVVPLFTGTPAQLPATGRITLDIAKVQLNGQPMPGTADVAVIIGSATSTTPCETGVPVGTFFLTFDDDGVTVAETELDLPQAAFDFVISGEFTICLQAGASTGVEIDIEEFGCAFGPPAADNEELPG